VKMFDAGKTRMIELPYGEKNCDDMLSCFHLIPERNGHTDGQTDRFAISISRVSMLTRDKNLKFKTADGRDIENRFCHNSTADCPISVNFPNAVWEGRRAGASGIVCNTLVDVNLS